MKLFFKTILLFVTLSFTVHDGLCEVKEISEKSFSVVEKSNSESGIVILDNNTPISKQIITENTIYEVNSVLDLKGEQIFVPHGCVIRFNYGLIENGILVGHETVIDAPATSWIFKQIAFKGCFDANNTSVKWFGARGNGEVADEKAIQTCIDFVSNNNNEKLVYFPQGKYKVNAPLLMPSTINLTLKGFGGHQNRRGSTIIAGSRINHLIGSKADSLNITVTELSFDGNMSGKYYNNGHFDYKTQSLAKHCFFFEGKYGATYSRFSNVYITGFSGEAIHGISYGTRISNCQIKRCGYGVRCKTANNVSISESELELIGFVAVLINGGSVSVRNCIFDINGQGALVANGCQFTVEDCYFEENCKNGVKFKVGNSILSGAFKFCIATVHNASNIVEGANLWVLHRLYPVEGCTIRNNDIDWLSEGENKYFVIASSMHNAEISNNRFRSDNFDAIFGFPLSTDAYCSINNVNISNNSTDGAEIKRALQLNPDAKALSSEGSVKNVFTTDPVSSMEYKNNLSNSLHVFGYNWGKNEQFVEKELQYKGQRVLKNESTKAARLCIARHRTPQGGMISPKLLADKTLQIQLYRSDDGKKWRDATQIYHVYEDAENLLITISVPAGQMVTAPVVTVLGEPLISNTEWEPPFFDQTGGAPANIKLLENSIIKSWGKASKYCSGQRVAYNQGKQILTMIPLGTLANKEEVEGFFGTNDYNGLWIMDNNTKQIIYRVNNTWVDSKGNTVQ